VGQGVRAAALPRILGLVLRGQRMKSVQQIAEEIVTREGGWSKDAADPGGATKYGVTIHTMRRLGIDKDGDGKVTVNDVKQLTRADAVAIFIKHYFQKPRLAELPEDIQASVFDMYVNAGANAVKILQRLIRDMGIPVSVDGVVGPKTIEAAHKAEEQAQGLLSDAYGIARRNYYFALADGRLASRKFAMTRAGGKGGWIRRAESFISPRYHMTDQEFRDRVSKWK
jgi:lysozyme family protein